MRWAIEIQATQLARRNLADLLGSIGFKLVDDASHLAFSSPALDKCDTEHEVYEIGKKVRASFTASATIDPYFRIGVVIDYSTAPPKRYAFAEPRNSVSASTSTSVMVTVLPPQGLTHEQLEKWKMDQEEVSYQAKLEAQLARLKPAFFSPKASKVLEMLAIKNPTGETVFKIYELMRGPASNAKVFGQQFGISNHEYHRFAEAVHLDSVTGDWARHAHGEPSKSGNPMTKEEAQAFVRRIASAWLKRVSSESS